ncbi:sulfite oxidase [Haloarcula sp. Atlit-7R]|uniref:sulfite oxidase n=1 Tax=Haloarcula sp. Atlit-7R TaxID=2282125 RepID=UPI000EF1533B|nr:sulfite oxidase [Haloarcula sp. Atlit-7R]RLM90644.1 sulfite oxidase [Haloarcula sp. Atlit-7R]
MSETPSVFQGRSRRALTVFASGVSVVGTSFALYGTTREFVIIAASRTALDVLPSSVVASIIWNFGDLSFSLAFLVFGIALAGVTGAVSYAGFRAGERLVGEAPNVGGMALSLAVVWAFVAATVWSPLAAVVPAAAGTVGTGLVIARSTDDADQLSTPDDRRAFVKTLAGLGAYNVVAHAVGFVQGSGSRTDELSTPPSESEASDLVQQRLDAAADRSLNVDGMVGLVDTTDSFFTVDINPRPPTVEAENWALSVTGNVETEREFTYEELRQRETVHRFKTLRCLGDPVDGEQIGTALWTGCSLLDLLDEAGANGSHVVLRATDDYYYSVPMSMLPEAMLAYGMNEQQLPREHGYPVRALIPNRWGKLNVKWLDEIEVVDQSESGYWEERGWNGMGTVNTVVKFGASNRPSDGRVQLGGHAYAGTDGIQEVRVSLDGGETWDTATLSDPLPDPDTWRQWKYEWQPDSTSYTVVAKAVDGTGTEQTRVRSSPFPDGATGWSRLDLSVQL